MLFQTYRNQWLWFRRYQATRAKQKIDLLFTILVFVYTLAIYQGGQEGFEHVVPAKREPDGKVCDNKKLVRFGLYQLKLQVKELAHLIQYLIELIEKL